MKRKPTFRETIFIIWAFLLVFCFILYVFNPTYFEAENIASFFEQFKEGIFLVYILACLVRGLILLPSTPFVLAGTILFPEYRIVVLLVSMIGILSSSTMLYYFSDYLGFSAYLENRYPSQILNIRGKLNSHLGLLFIFGWAFLPVVPTDLIAYVAGTSKMNFKKFIFAVFLGEIIICYLYVYFGAKALDFYNMM